MCNAEDYAKNPSEQEEMQKGRRTINIADYVNGALRTLRVGYELKRTVPDSPKEALEEEMSAIAWSSLEMIENYCKTAETEGREGYLKDPSYSKRLDAYKRFIIDYKMVCDDTCFVEMAQKAIEQLDKTNANLESISRGRHHPLAHYRKEDDPEQDCITGKPMSK